MIGVWISSKKDLPDKHLQVIGEEKIIMSDPINHQTNPALEQLGVFVGDWNIEIWKHDFDLTYIRVM